jgi:hypothetical protein
MNEQSDAAHARRYQALRDRYPAEPQAQEYIDPNDVRALQQAVGDLSGIVSSLVAHLIAASNQADAGDTAEGPSNRERLDALRTAAEALRGRYASEIGQER